MSLNNRVSLLDLVQTTNENTNILNNSFIDSNYLIKVVKFGSISESNGIISNFSTANYAKLPVIFNPGNLTWEICLKVKINELPSWGTSDYYRVLDDEVDTTAISIAIQKHNNNLYSQLFLRSNDPVNTNWDISSDNSNFNYPINLNQWTWIKIIYDGTTYSLYQSINGLNYTKIIQVESNKVLNPQNSPLCLGMGSFVYNQRPLNGEIDLNSCFININGNRFWSGVERTSNNFANADLSNLSTITKSVLTSLILPDLAHGINMNLPIHPITTTTDTFICPSNGWINVGMRKPNYGNTAHLWVNDVQVGLWVAYDGKGTNVFVPVSKDDVVLINSDSTSATDNDFTILQQDFYPMKGV